MGAVTEHWRYMAARNFYGRTRLYSLTKALKLFVLWFLNRDGHTTARVTCWKCGDDHVVSKRSLYYYDNTKCGRCYL